MPLLGKLIFNESGEDIPTDFSGEVYEISHTGEKFISKELFDERIKLYERKVWTCQCTGHINLSHEEATDSEEKIRKRLAKTFHEVYERPVLNSIHHSSEILEKAVDRAYKTVQSRLFLNETVTFEGVPGRKHEAKVVKVCEEGMELAESGSPSSDKENHSSKQSLISDIFKSEKSSDHMSSGSSSSDNPSTLSTEMKYDILLLKENKVIRGVPATTLERNQKQPCRYGVKLFIRSNTFRCEYKKHKVWIVNTGMVEKHGLSCKLSPKEEKKFLEASSISSKGFVGYTHHGALHVNGDSGDVEHQSTNVKPHSGFIGDQSVGEDRPLRKLAPIFSPKSKAKTKLKNAIELSPIKAASSVVNLSTKSGKSQSLKRKLEGKNSKSKSPKKKKVSASVIEIISDNDDDIPLSKLAKSKEHSSTSKTSSRKNTSPKKKRQATLLELTKKKGGKMLMTSKKSLALGSSPSSSPSKKSRSPRQPPIVYRLLRLKQEKKFQGHKYKMLLNVTARMLTEKQRSNLPDLVKEEVILKWEMIERKRKWDSMTPEERKMSRNAERIMKNKKHEDMDIFARGEAKALPLCEPVVIPGGLPNTMFGNIAMVTEFFNCHKSLFSNHSQDLRMFNYWTIAEALCSGKKGFDVISHILICIFQILLSDGVADGYKDLDFHIDEVPKTPEVCSELARICLRQFDDDLETQNIVDDDNETAQTPGTGISEETFLKLLDNEIYELGPADQLDVLCSLIYRFINTYSAQNFRDDMKEKASVVWKKFFKLRTEDNLLKKEKKMKEEQEKDAPATEAKDEEKSRDNIETEQNNDLVSRVKRRRVDAVERKRIEEEKKLQWDEERRKLFEEQSKKAETDKLRKQVRDTEASSSRAFRLTTLGTDRHHSRYWFFSEYTPGLYIEKGWIDDSINYTTYSEFDGKKNEGEGDALSSERSTPERTLPHVGQNLWFVVDSKEKFDELLSSLCHSGYRESALKKVLEKKYNHIIKSIAKYENSLPKQQKDSLEGEKVSPYATRKSNIVKDAAEDCKKSLRKRLQTMIHDISKGNLGNIQDEYEVFVAKVDSAEDVSDFKTLLLDIFNAIDMRFFRQYMNGCAVKKNQTREDLLPYKEQEKQLANSRKIALAEKRRERWIAAVEGAVHFSRLSFLLTILHSNVMWDMFKYCRTAHKRQSARIKNYASMVEQAEDEEDDYEMNMVKEKNETEKDFHPPTRRFTRLNGVADTCGLRKSRRNKVVEDSYEEEAEKSSGDDDAEDDEEEDGEGNEDETSESEEEEESEDEEELESEDEELGRCSAIINRLLQYKCSSFFRYRVEEEDVPDYYDVIQNPICLLDIKEKIERAEGAKERTGNTRTRSATRGPPAIQPYLPDQLLDDFRLVLDNAEMYNGRDSPVWRQAIKLKSAFSRCFLENFRYSVRLTKKLRSIFSDDN